MDQEEMTARERVLASLRHQSTDLIPFSLGFGVNEPAQVQLKKHLGLKNLQLVRDYLLGYSDIRSVVPAYIGPKDRHMKLTDGCSIDIWNIKRRPVSYGSGHYNEISEYPLAGIKSASELDQVLWPSPDWWDMSVIPAKIKAYRGRNEYAIQTGVANIFETAWYMRGFEQMLIDLIEAPELSWAIMERITDYFTAYYERLLQAAKSQIDIVFTADDIGQQQGLLMSLDLWRKMIKPHHTRLNKVLKQFDVKVMYHSDGAIMEAVPDLIDMGIDILEALQFDARGMDPHVLKHKYGQQLCFHGGISVQTTLPFGSTEDVADEVKQRIKTLGRNGGYIMAPSHAIQAGTPPENIVAFLQAARPLCRLQIA